MTVQEAWNRGNNLLATGVVALSGFAFLPELFIEDKWQYKLDEGFLFLLGLRAICWYKTGNNRFRKSIFPVIFVLAGLAIKILGIILEFKEKDDVGDDFGALILFMLASSLVIWMYKKNKHIK